MTTTGTATSLTVLSITTKTTALTETPYIATRYQSTVTVTSSDYQLAYTTAAPSACLATVTHAAQCAPTNVISSRDGRSVPIEWLLMTWAVPITFPSTLIGVPGLDLGGCFQLLR